MFVSQLFQHHRLHGRWLQQPKVTEVTGLSYDSRKVESGHVFVCIRGTKHDSHSLLQDVCAHGPAVVVVEEASSVPVTFQGGVFVVASGRRALAALSEVFWGCPSSKMFVIGVTGTNGKTTCTYLLEFLLRKSGHTVGRIGTTGASIGGEPLASELTTPGPFELQKLLKTMHDKGATAIAMEVSSIALDQDRVFGIDFDGAIFTNLTHDHLDYHKTFEAYFHAKRRFFAERLAESTKSPKIAVINDQDSYGQRLLSEVHCVGVDQEHSSVAATLKTPSKTHWRWRHGGQELASEFCLIGDYNLMNLNECLLLLKKLLPEFKAPEDWSEFAGVPGRMQPIECRGGRVAFVDYAHTPDALENSLKALQPWSRDHQVVCVFGCGGGRDRKKRTLMADVVERSGTHRVYVTSDNPRDENPERIIDDVLQGFSKTFLGSHVKRVTDRKQAIRAAIQESEPGALILVAGKGHESYQEVNGQRFELSDVAIIKEVRDANSI